MAVANMSAVRTRSSAPDTLAVGLEDYEEDSHHSGCQRTTVMAAGPRIGNSSVSRVGWRVEWLARNGDCSVPCLDHSCCVSSRIDDGSGVSNLEKDPCWEGACGGNDVPCTAMGFCSARLRAHGVLARRTSVSSWDIQTEMSGQQIPALQFSRLRCGSGGVCKGRR